MKNRKMFPFHPYCCILVKHCLLGGKDSEGAIVGYRDAFQAHGNSAAIKRFVDLVGSVLLVLGQQRLGTALGDA
jgi:hypothetical protein